MIPCPPCAAERGTRIYILGCEEKAQCPDCGDIYGQNLLCKEDMNRVNEILSLQSQFKSALITTATCRDKRQSVVKTIWGDELEWVTHERGVLLAAVNNARINRGHLPVTAEDIHRVEQLAVGHCDYADKFALYCAEIVLKKD